MITFTDQAKFLKGTAIAYLQDVQTNDIVAWSNKFQTAGITTSYTQGEIRGGLGNPIVAMVGSDSALNVNFAAADFNLAIKAGQLGASLAYGAPVMVCQTVTATGAELAIDVSGGTPVAALGATDVVCFVQDVNAASPIATGGTAYALDAATGAIDGFTATSGKTYKVWYHISQANAQVATINSIFDAGVYRFVAVFAVYDNSGMEGSNTGTHVGNLTAIVPRLKLDGANGGITGDQTNADTTVISGQALAYDASVIGDDCDECAAGGSPLAYYIYTPCDTTDGIEGLVAELGGVVSVAVSSTYQLHPALVVNGELVQNMAASDFTYAMVGAISGTTVNASTGLVTAGTTTGDAEITVTYTNGTDTFTDTVNLSVVSA